VKGPRRILHVDMDAFFVAVEVRADPSLRGRPVVVGGSGDRGVVAAASYEARAYGVESAMPSARARRLCPDAVFIAARHGRYREASERVMAIFGSFTSLVQPLSLDEAFLDVSGARTALGPAPRIAADIRTRVQSEEQLACSVGVAGNLFLAKLASEAAKPTPSRAGPVEGPGVTVIEPGAELSFLHPLPVAALWGVGPATLGRLERLGVTTVGQLAALPLDAVRRAIGDQVGRHLHALAHGRDDRPVEVNQVPKSISHEETFERDRRSVTALRNELVKLADSVGSRLRAHRLAARTVVLKVRFGDFRTITRSVTLDRPADTGPELVRPAHRLLGEVDITPGVRLIGLAGTGLTDAAVRQLALGDAPWPEATEAMDDIRQRFGSDAIRPAAATGPQPGDELWGSNP